jgi:LmbE family N-acetylglucosaminyl deacetylase
VRQVLVSGVERPNLFVDVSGTFEIGLQALFCHVSQIADRADVEEWVRKRAADLGEPVGLSLANAFLSIVID